MAKSKLTTRERFESKVSREGDHWLWTGSTIQPRQTDGLVYGTFKVAGRVIRAHRFAYELLVGPIPDGLLIDHRCHVPLCVRPDHLRVVTNAENMQNRSGAQRDSKTGIRGVWWAPNDRKWRVGVKHLGRVYYGGRYTDLAEAEAAAIRLRNTLFTHNDLDRVAV